MPKLNDQPMWLVRNATERSELQEVVWKTSLTELVAYVVGIGLDAWHSDQSIIYDNESEALEDARGRMESPAGEESWILGIAPGFAGVSDDARPLGRYKLRALAMVAGETIRRHGSEETRRARLAIWAEKRGKRIDGTWREIP